MSDDIIERMARAMYANRPGFNLMWKEVAERIRRAYVDDARAAYAIARRATLEEAAKAAEGMYQHGQIGSDIAAAIRNLAGEA